MTATAPDRTRAGKPAAEAADRAEALGPDEAAPLLSVRGLSVRFRMRGRKGGAAFREIAAVSDVSFDLAPGECLALVGESGCGKSVLASALLGLLPGNAYTRGRALLHDGLDLLAADEATLSRSVRGRRLGLVPQSPAAHLTPVRTVRAQLEETVAELTGPATGGARGRPGWRGREERRRIREAAREAAARAAFPEGHLDAFPHQLSGGLAQRAATALALVGDAPLLVADEPTTGLDRDLVTRTVDELRRHTADGRGLVIITHDLAAAERVADRTAVMYAGRIVELAPATGFFAAPGPRHPYAHGLLEALPERAFRPVPGMPPELGDLPAGCAFAPRCAHATDVCAAQPPLDNGTACHHPLHQDEPPHTATAAGGDDPRA